MTSGVIKQPQGAHTTKQLWGSYFMKAYITIVLSVALGIHTAAPCSFLRRPRLSEYWMISLFSVFICLFTMGESKLSFLFSGVVSPIPGVLNVKSSPRWCPHGGLTRRKTLQLNTCWHHHGASVGKLLKCHDSATIWHCTITSLVCRS